MNADTIRKMAKERLARKLEEAGVDTTGMERQQMIELLIAQVEPVPDVIEEALFEMAEEAAAADEVVETADEAVETEDEVEKSAKWQVVEELVVDNVGHTQTLIAIVGLPAELIEFARAASEDDKPARNTLLRKLRPLVQAWAAAHGSVFGPDERKGIGYNARYQVPDAMVTFQVYGTPTTRKIFTISVVEG